MALMTVFVIDKNPGPGSYNNCQSFKRDGANQVSFYKSTCTPKIRIKTKKATKYDRIPAADPYRPGPAAYSCRIQSLYGAMENLNQRLGMKAAY